MAKKSQTKGSTGKSTGKSTRSAIKKAVNKGNTLEQIGKKVNRDGSTISSILGGKIKNPPKGLASKISKIAAPKTKASGSAPKGSKATKAFKKHR